MLVRCLLVVLFKLEFVFVWLVFVWIDLRVTV